jgi:hypothetical protein
VIDAIGVTDLRAILLVRRAFHVLPQNSHKETESKPVDGDWVDIWAQQNERSESDDEDEGGEEGMNKSTDKSHLRMKRAFELLLKSGHVIRFEVRSCLEYLCPSSSIPISGLFTSCGCRVDRTPPSPPSILEGKTSH